MIALYLRLSRVLQVLDRFLAARYADDSAERIAVRESVRDLCRRYINRGLADPTFVQVLCSGDEGRYWQRLSEALLAHELIEAGLDVRPSRSGPDLLVMDGERKIWIEVICPEPVGVPEEWLRFEPHCVKSLPDEAILLRWTAAIKEKAEKLLGNPAKEAPGYIGRGVVSPGDAYVIAVNGRRLRDVFCSLMGISQFPFAVEAVFPVGPYEVRIDRDTLQAVGGGHQFRPSVENANRALVPTSFFLDPSRRAVSAIWATDIDDCGVIGNSRQMVVVHNPMATNPVRERFLPAWFEYVATPCDSGDYLLERKNGRLT